MTRDGMLEQVSRLSAVSEQREAERSSRLRRDANECGFTAFYRDLHRVFGAGTRIVYFQGRDGSYGSKPPAGIPFSLPVPPPLKPRRVK